LLHKASADLMLLVLHALLLLRGQVHEQLSAAGLAAQGQRRSEDDVLTMQPAPSAAEVCSGKQSGLKLTGFRKGSALLIWNILVDAQTPDPTSAHVVCGPGFGSKVGVGWWTAWWSGFLPMLFGHYRKTVSK
jgi:hypothetical protein